MKHFFYLFLLIQSVYPSRFFACSAFFSVNDKIIFGRNLDWYFGDGYMLKNNRGQKKYSYTISNTSPANWTSKYGSFTFNQIGKEFPYGGINEKGLIVEQLWLHSTTYQDNSNQSISELEWVQFQLDNYENIHQIIDNIHSLTIKPIKATVHYFVADKNGNSAVIDFLNGKAYISSKKGKTQVLTNTAYELSCSYYAAKKNNIDTLSRLSEDRYCQVSQNLEKYNPAIIPNAMMILDLSSENQKDYKTYWSIVYNLTDMEIYFKSYDNRNVKTVKINDYTFDNASKGIFCDINTNLLEFKDYTFEANKQLLETSLKKLNLTLDNQKAAYHQFNPSLPSIDSIYLKTYSTIKIQFRLKSNKGNLYYTVTAGEDNFKMRRGIVSTMIKVDSNIVYSEVYAINNGEYAIASFHDVNGNKKLDGGLFGIPTEPYAFSKNKKGLFGLPPKYKKVKFELKSDCNFIIKY